MLRVQWREKWQYIHQTKPAIEMSEGEAVFRHIRCICSQSHAVAATKETYESANGRKRYIRAMILSLYILFEAPDDAGAVIRFPQTDVLQRLMGNNRNRKLTGSKRNMERIIQRIDKRRRNKQVTIRLDKRKNQAGAIELIKTVDTDRTRSSEQYERGPWHGY